jgi:histidinol dehydrogenase
MTFIIVADKSAKVDRLVVTVSDGIRSMDPARIVLVSTDASLALDASEALERLEPRRRDAWSLRGSVVVADDAREAACIVAAASPATIALRLEDERAFMTELSENLHPAVRNACALDRDADIALVAHALP